jgi:hypothetical protein
MSLQEYSTDRTARLDKTIANFPESREFGEVIERGPDLARGLAGGTRHASEKLLREETWWPPRAALSRRPGRAAANSGG